jgi:hypothetical protein
VREIQIAAAVRAALHGMPADKLAGDDLFVPEEADVNGHGM